MTEKKPERGSLTMGIAGIGAAVFGVIWTIEANSMAQGSPFGDGPSVILTAGGILFTAMAVLIAVRGFRGASEEETAPGDSGTEGKPGNPPREKAAWTCPYCGTEVNGEERFCPGCGAGRKK